MGSILLRRGLVSLTISEWLNPSNLLLVPAIASLAYIPVTATTVTVTWWHVVSRMRASPLRSDWFLCSSQFVFRSDGVVLLSVWFWLYHQ
ncbi:unnamed protein product [Microthlaspi erraticum]|uniref:Uncharacterized protein n=1 Tax=Microthlaspi erraticum TaxID=1685480 RepID=A0A6D2IKY2_9BRAS|nr:unnamed protein product [Microthlaspi erraticum]